jgi:hypothetical protein
MGLVPPRIIPFSWESGATPDLDAVEWPLKSSVYTFPDRTITETPQEPAYESMLLNAGYDAEIPIKPLP